MGCKALEPMGKWVKGEGEGCRPCKVALGMGRYRKALQEAGQDDLVEVVRGAIDLDGDDTIGNLAAAMDTVKAKAPPAVKATLESIDCDIQNKEECGACEVPVPAAAPVVDNTTSV